MMLCPCESGDKNSKLACFKRNLADFYKFNGAYDSTLEKQLEHVSSFDDFDFVNYWGLTGFDCDGGGIIGGIVGTNKNSAITTQIITSNIILNRFFQNLSKNHTTFQKSVKLPESTIYTKVFQNSL